MLEQHADLLLELIKKKKHSAAWLTSELTSEDPSVSVYFYTHHSAMIQSAWTTERHERFHS